MRASSNDNHSTPNSNKRGVTFDVMETLERNSDCIDNLMSLVSAMKMTIDKKQSPYKPKIYQGRSRNQHRNRQNFMSRNRSFSRGRRQSGNRGNYNYRNKYRQITEIDQEADGTIIGQVIEVTITILTIDKLIIDQIMDKTLNGHLETGVKVETELEITTMTIQEVEVEIEIMIGQFSQDKAHYLMEEMDLGPTLR